jgi:hypothetical protein
VKYAKILVIPMLVAAVAGCHTFTRVKPDYRDLPVDALREVALEIEQAVQRGDREPEISDREGIVVSTEAIRHAIRTRAARSELVNELLDRGHGWEKRGGLLATDRGKEYKKATTRQQRDRDALLVMSENDDRWVLYEGILKASGISPKSLSATQLIFFEARVKCMRNGQKYEDESGERAYVGGAPKSTGDAG